MRLSIRFYLSLVFLFYPTWVPPALSDTRSESASLSPVDIERLEGKCHVALAGHFHGCQFVFWRRGFDLYPGKLFYSNNFTERRIETLAYFISRGLGETLPLRLNCPREVLRVRVVPKYL